MIQWRKSSRSADSGQADCVELARLTRAVGVRDSKDPGGPKVALPAASFRDLVTTIKRGDHDMP
ncbi:DUF397 domain-containing protein [Actinomadura rubrisoli]|uniref:DUF397 domain-containing protein n=1 Tax=Actinomadura rubrisoli TaxID=2530368 RepID=A0A4R5BJV6_9ACTN|nr:DUF397 domain-containing protein [Actinomadura rubrisoli]TDD85929.1 DUF397 domain-containing protein [Actinomadura rubrisoli]